MKGITAKEGTTVGSDADTIATTKTLVALCSQLQIAVEKWKSF